MLKKSNFFSKVIITAIIIFIIVIITLLKLLIFGNPSQDWNLVFISVDTLRADHMGVYGYPKNTTPHIDQLAKHAYVFSNMVTAVPETYPSFAALMTGRQPFTTNIFRNSVVNPISENTETIAKVLKEHNFTNAAFITNDGLRGEITNMDQGFDVYGYNSSQSSRDSYYKDEVDQPLNWLKKNKDKHFFLWVHFLDPHSPYEPPDDLLCKYNQKMCSLIKGKSLSEIEKERLKYAFCPKEQPSQEQIAFFETLYDGEVAAADRLVGKILSGLEQSRLSKKTVIVFFADHGEGFDHDYNFEHRGVLYNSAIRMPFIVSYPNQFKEKKVDILVQNIDIFPTILNLFGITSKNLKLDGISFSSIFQNNLFTRLFPPKTRNISYLTNADLTKFAIYDGRYKFVFSLEESCLYKNQTEELYDLKNDPAESKNILTKEKKLGSELKNNLLSFLEGYNLPNSGNREKKMNIQEIQQRLKSLGY